MVGEVFRRPSFFIWFAAMFLTAASELAPGQWIDVALSNRVGMRGLLLLAYVNALMFVFRPFAGRLANKISNPGLPWVSSLIAARPSVVSGHGVSVGVAFGGARCS